MCSKLAGLLNCVKFFFGINSNIVLLTFGGGKKELGSIFFIFFMLNFQEESMDILPYLLSL